MNSDSTPYSTNDAQDDLTSGPGPRTTVTHPDNRTERLSQFARAMGADANMQYMLRIQMTPIPLRVLSDHAIRGKKSLGQIQRLTNRRRFKARAA